MLVGGLVGFSMIGIEWSKLQWLVAALGVGLGFGLQEIFANFISGLIILFEKPIRIGDTVVTIRDLTGSVTCINTRATTISDWDRKEIIVPNKAFITEQFINWSLSDSVTRVVLTVPAPADADTEEVTKIPSPRRIAARWSSIPRRRRRFSSTRSRGSRFSSYVFLPRRWGTACRCAMRCIS